MTWANIFEHPLVKLQEGNDRNGWKTLKTLTTYGAKSDFYSETGDNIGYVVNPRHIPSPYSYSPTRAVYTWRGQKVIIMDTKHKYFEVIAVPSSETIYKTDEQATGAFIAAGSGRN